MPRRRILKRAPVVYILMQLRFAPILAMAKYLPDIQDALRRSGFPLMAEDAVKEVRVELNDGAVQTATEHRVAWHFQDAGKTAAVVLRPDSFVFHASAYQDFERFLEAALKALELVHHGASLGPISGLGLRYVDVLCPDAQGSADRHLVAGLAGVEGRAFAQVEDVPNATGLDAVRERRMLESVYRTAHGMLVQRVIENAGQPALPPDVLECKLKLRDLHANTEGRFVTLDTDHFRSEENTPFDLSMVEKGLRDLHAGTSAAFFAAINEEGAASWEQ